MPVFARSFEPSICYGNPNDQYGNGRCGENSRRNKIIRREILNQQLAEIKNQLDAASDKAARIVNAVDFEQLYKRPKPDKWSIAECLVHLNLSSQAEIAEIDGAIENAPPGNANVQKPFKMDLLGGFLKWMLEPPPLFFSKMKTTKLFQPVEVESVGEVLPEFLALQEQLKARVDMVAALPLDRIKIRSPFDRRVKYNLFSFFHILLAHERRHLWQAEKVKQNVFTSAMRSTTQSS